MCEGDPSQILQSLRLHPNGTNLLEHVACFDFP